MQIGKPGFLDLIHLLAGARESGLNVAAFRECLESNRHKQEIESGAQEALSKGIRGTPAFILGKTSSSTIEGELVIGATSFEDLDHRLEQVISQ